MEIDLPKSMEDTSIDWDSLFLGMASVVSFKSKDPSQKVGAVVVQDNIPVSVGFNGFPRGIRECEFVKMSFRQGDKGKLDELRWSRPEKYQRIEHAERNAIYNAARLGVRLEGATIYTTLHPCDVCARAIIQAGIAKVVYEKMNNWSPLGKGRHPDSCLTISSNMLKEAGVSVQAVKSKVQILTSHVPDLKE